jgi:hypothetical protein
MRKSICSIVLGLLAAPAAAQPGQTPMPSDPPPVMQPQPYPQPMPPEVQSIPPEQPPPGATRATFVSTGEARWDVRIDNNACTPFAASNNGGFCCETTPDGARAAYPGKNLVVLPGQTQLAPDQIPPLRHVDGYIIQNAIDHTKLEYRGAVDGAMDGIAECCTADVATMRREHPTENLAYLPSFGQ